MGRLAGPENSQLARGTDARVKASVQLAQHIIARTKDVLRANLLEHAAALHHRLGLSPELRQIQPAAHVTPSHSLLRQQLRASQVDKMDVRGHQQQVAVQWLACINLLQGLLQVVDSAKKDRAVDAHDFQLRAIGQAGCGTEDRQPWARFGLDVFQGRSRAAMKVEH